MERDSRKYIETYLNQTEGPFNTLVIKGARQVGKTTLIEDCLKSRDHLALNLEKNKIAKEAIDQTKSFEEFTQYLKIAYDFTPNTQKILFIDEAQESDLLGLYVRDFKETWKSTQVILSGSSMNKFFSEKQRVPVGRIENILIQPFSFREFLRWNKKEPLLMETKELKNISDHLHLSLLKEYDIYIKIGGLPEVVKAWPDPKYKNILQDLLLTQKEDFLRKEKVDSHFFLDGLRTVSNHVGYPAKYSQMNCSQYSAKKILNHLLDWNLIYEIEVRGGSSTQSISHKRYVYDLGIMNLMRNLATPSIHIIDTIDERLRQPLGGVIENAFLINFLANHQQAPLISTWRKNPKTPIEVDFVIEKNHQKYPVEVKASTNTNPRHAKNLVQYLHAYQLNEGFLVSLDKPKTFLVDGKKIQNIPIYLICDL